MTQDCTMPPLSGEAFRKALSKIGLTPASKGAAQFLGLSLRQVQRISAGEYPAPESAAKLLALMNKGRIKAADWSRLVPNT